MGRVTDAFRRASEDRLPAKPEVQATDKALIAQFSDQTLATSLNGHQPEQTNDTATPIIGAAEDPSKQSAWVRTGPAQQEEGLKSVPENGRVKPRRRTFGNWIEKCLLGRDTDALRARPLLALEEYSPAGEQYKILREQIKKIASERGSRILAVTSPLKGDGKSTVAANLAATIALDYEQQVLVIDGDLRGPSIHQFFGIESTPGLVEYLTSDSGTDGMSYIQKTSISGLRIFTAGKSSIHASELLAKERMKALMREIRAGLPDHLNRGHISHSVDTRALGSCPAGRWRPHGYSRW
jgi:hypothetical protein